MVAAVAHIQGVKREVQLLQPKNMLDLDFTKNSNNLFHYRTGKTITIPTIRKNILPLKSSKYG